MNDLALICHQVAIGAPTKFALGPRFGSPDVRFFRPCHNGQLAAARGAVLNFLETLADLEHEQHDDMRCCIARLRLRQVFGDLLGECVEKLGKQMYSISRVPKARATQARPSPDGHADTQNVSTGSVCRRALVSNPLVQIRSRNWLYG